MRTTITTRSGHRTALALLVSLSAAGLSPSGAATAERIEKLAPRCYRQQVVVPDTVARLKQQLKKWIGSCVASRTLDRNGKPIQREEDLVELNASVATLWAEIANLEGTPIQIRASYRYRDSDDTVVEAVSFTWEASRVDFGLDEAETITGHRPPPPRRPTIATAVERSLAALKRADLGRRRSRMLCAVEKALHEPDNPAGSSTYHLKYIPFNNLVERLRPATLPMTDDGPLSARELEPFFWDLGNQLYSMGKIGLDREGDRAIVDFLVYQFDEQLAQAIAVANGYGMAETKANLTKAHLFIRSWMYQQSQNPNSIYYCYR